MNLSEAPMYYDTVVVGLGPSGISYGLETAHLERRTLFLEANTSLGGCWRFDYDRNGLYTEHSPKVMFKYYNREANQLIERVGASLRFKDVYASSNTLQLLRAALARIGIRDALKIITFVLLYIFGQHDQNITVHDWCAASALSPKAFEMIRSLSILVSNTPDKIRMAVLVSVLFAVRMLMSIDQLVDPGEWLEGAESSLRKISQFEIRYGCRVDRLLTHEHKVTHVVTMEGEHVATNRVVLCVPLRNLLRIAESSPSSLHRNWFDSLESFRRFVEASSYTGLGFQLHFERPMRYPARWCWSCEGDWNVIVVDKSHSLGTFTKNDRIRTMWSCVVVDLDTKSAFLGRSANECPNLREVFEEAIRQIEEGFGESIGKYLLTTHAKITRGASRWEAWESSFSDAFGPMPHTGSIPNLHSLGPHNESKIATIESAVRSVKRFCRTQASQKKF